MPNKLHKLKITEVSSVPAGAGSGARVMLMKRDGDAATVSPAGRRKKPKRPKNLFEHQEAARAAARAARGKPKKMSKAYRRFKKLMAKTRTLDADKLSRRIEKGVAKGLSWEAAASAAYRKTLDGDAFDRSVIGHVSRDTPPPMASLEPVEITTEAYGLMMKRAWEISDATGETPEAAFARIYADPRNRGLVQQEKNAFLSRATKALRLNGNADGNDKEPDLDSDDVAKRINKILKADPKLGFERAATLALRRRAT